MSQLLEAWRVLQWFSREGLLCAERALQGSSAPKGKVLAIEIGAAACLDLVMVTKKKDNVKPRDGTGAEGRETANAIMNGQCAQPSQARPIMKTNLVEHFVSQADGIQGLIPKRPQLARYIEGALYCCWAKWPVLASWKVVFRIPLELLG